MNEPNVILYEKKDNQQMASELFLLADEAYPQGSPWTEEQFMDDLSAEHSRYLLLQIEQQIAGFIGYQQVLDEVEISNFAVASSQQKNGYGGKILKGLFQQVSETAAVIFLEVRVSNHSAQNLYLANGFEVIGRRKNYYSAPTEDALIMRKKVR